MCPRGYMQHLEYGCRRRRGNANCCRLYRRWGGYDLNSLDYVANAYPYSQIVWVGQCSAYGDDGVEFFVSGTPGTLYPANVTANVYTAGELKGYGGTASYTGTLYLVDLNTGATWSTPFESGSNTVGTVSVNQTNFPTISANLTPYDNYEAYAEISTWAGGSVSTTASAWFDPSHGGEMVTEKVTLQVSN